MPGKILSPSADDSTRDMSSTTGTAMAQSDPPTDPALLSSTPQQLATSVDAQDHDRKDFSAGDLAAAAAAASSSGLVSRPVAASANDDFFQQLQQQQHHQHQHQHQQPEPIHQASQSHQIVYVMPQVQSPQSQSPSQPTTPCGGGQVCR